MNCISKARSGEYSQLILLYTLMRFPLDSFLPFVTASGLFWVCQKVLPRCIGYPIGIVIFASFFFFNLPTTLDRIKGQSLQKIRKTSPSAATLTFSDN